MVSKKIRITGAQLSFPVGAIQQNKQTILDAIEVGEQNQSDIVVFPELANRLSSGGFVTQRKLRR